MKLSAPLARRRNRSRQEAARLRRRAPDPDARPAAAVLPPAQDRRVLAAARHSPDVPKSGLARARERGPSLRGDGARPGE